MMDLLDAQHKDWRTSVIRSGNPDPGPRVPGDDPCGVCSRDNRNGTHTALEGHHLSHHYISAYKVETMNAASRVALRTTLLDQGCAIESDGPLGTEAVARRLRAEDSGPDYDAEDGPEVPEETTRPQRLPLLFPVFSETNAARCSRWHPGFPATDSWTLADWSNALAGETGELANVIKKIRRLDTAHYSKRADEQDRAELVAKAGDEIGDVLAYLDLLATKLGLDLATVAVNKFNAISVREDYPERIDL